MRVEHFATWNFSLLWSLLIRLFKWGVRKSKKIFVSFFPMFSPRPYLQISLKALSIAGTYIHFSLKFFWLLIAQILFFLQWIQRRTYYNSDYKSFSEIVYLINKQKPPSNTNLNIGSPNMRSRPGSNIRTIISRRMERLQILSVLYRKKRIWVYCF